MGSATPSTRATEGRRAARRGFALPGLVHDDSPVGELWGRPKKLAQVLLHPVRGLPVALLCALPVLEDAHRDELVFPLAGNQDEVRDEPLRVPDEGNEVVLYPPDHLVDRGGVRLVVAYRREHIRCSFPYTSCSQRFLPFVPGHNATLSEKPGPGTLPDDDQSSA